jgi:hypothetical protein
MIANQALPLLFSPINKPPSHKNNNIKKTHPLFPLNLGPRLRPRHRRLRRQHLRRPRLHTHRFNLPQRRTSLPRRGHRFDGDPRTRIHLPSENVDVRFNGRCAIESDPGGGGEIREFGVCVV